MPGLGLRSISRVNFTFELIFTFTFTFTFTVIFTYRKIRDSVLNYVIATVTYYSVPSKTRRRDHLEQSRVKGRITLK